MAEPKFVEVPSGTGGLHGNAAVKAKSGNYLGPGGRDKASLPVTATVDEMLGPQQRREDEAMQDLKNGNLRGRGILVPENSASLGSARAAGFEG